MTPSSRQKHRRLSVRIHAREEQWEQWLPILVKMRSLLSCVFPTWLLESSCLLRVTRTLLRRMLQEPIRLTIVHWCIRATVHGVVVPNRNTRADLDRLRICVQTPSFCLLTSLQIRRNSALPRNKRTKSS